MIPTMIAIAMVRLRLRGWAQYATASPITLRRRCRADGSGAVEGVESGRGGEVVGILRVGTA
jgi:hypothetical protein